MQSPVTKSNFLHEQRSDHVSFINLRQPNCFCAACLLKITAADEVTTESINGCMTT